jgi:hypothetical protein
MDTENTEITENTETKSEDFGMTSWDDEQSQKPTPRKKFVKTRWDNLLKFKQGENRLRLLTNPYYYYMHKYLPENADSKAYADKIKCSMANGSCAICDLAASTGNKKLNRIKRYYVGVIDRRTQSYKVLDIAPGLYTKLQTVFRDEDWGDLTQFDITVIVDENAVPANYYSVVPKPKAPLSAQDLELKKCIDIEDLKLKSTPSDSAYVVKRMSDADSKYISKTAHMAQVVAKEDEDVPEAVEGNEDDFSFPPAQV